MCVGKAVLSRTEWLAYHVYQLYYQLSVIYINYPLIFFFFLLYAFMELKHGQCLVGNDIIVILK